MKIKLLLVTWILSCSSSFSQNTFFGNRLDTDRRVKKLKQSTVQILVDKEKCGTGFFVTDKGITITNFHVIINPRLRIQNNQIISQLSIVDFKNDTIPVIIKIDLSKESVVNEARIWDYIILQPQKEIKANFLKLGNFKNVYDGASVYTCGFPLDLKVPLITTGTFSTTDTQTQTIGVNKYERQIGWLDMTTNKGNSGGALMLLGNTPDEDEIIGITSFILVPFYKELEDLNNYTVEIGKNNEAIFLGIDFLKYMRLINTATNSNSVGISGCVSIEKAANYFSTKSPAKN